MQKEYKVIVNFYSPEYGGRKMSISVGYRPHFVSYGAIPTGDSMCGVQFVALPSRLDMSKMIEAEVKFLYDGINYNQLLLGDKRFQIYEGPKIIGEGEFI